MPKWINLFFVGLFGFFLTSCCCPPSPSETVAAPAQPQPPAQFAVANNDDCGEPFPGFDWLNGNVFAYEIIDKRYNQQGFKVKTLEHRDGFMVHLNCARNLPDIATAYDWLRQSGYTFHSYGGENNRNKDTGQYITVDKGVLLRP